AADRGARVYCLARRPERLAVAAALGAEETLDVTTEADPAAWLRERVPGGRGADRVVEAVGRTQTWELAVQLARPGGVVNLFGGCPSGTQIVLDTGRMHYEALTLVGTFHHTPDTIRRALGFLADGTVPAAPFLQERAHL